MPVEILSRLRQREKTGLIVAGFMLLLMVLEWMVVPRLIAECRAREERLTETKRKLEYCRSALAFVGRAEEEYRRVERILGRAESPEQALADFKGRMDDIARRNGVVIQAMEHRSPSPPLGVRSDDCMEYTVVIGSFEGQAESVLKFASDVERSADIITVSRFALLPGAQPGMLKGSAEFSRLMLKGPE